MSGLGTRDQRLAPIGRWVEEGLESSSQHPQCAFQREKHTGNTSIELTSQSGVHTEAARHVSHLLIIVEVR
jgi:hypothetical protein